MGVGIIFRTSMALLILPVLSTQAQVTYEVSATDGKGVFRHPFTVANAWTPNTVSLTYKSRNPFIEYYCFYNVFGSNPSRTQDELYDEDASGNPVYHFDGLATRISTILAAGLKPYLALGSCPVKLASNPSAVSAEYGTMTCKPYDYGKYKAFVTAFFNDLNSRYGATEVASWRYRLMTEPDNPSIWSDSLGEWFKFYDYTVSGARAANPNVRIAPGNWMNTTPAVLRAYAQHIRSGVFAVPGESSYIPPRLTMSFYSPTQPNQQSDGPYLIGNIYKSIVVTMSSYPEFANVPWGIDEGYVIADQNGNVVLSREIANEWGAAHFAYLAQMLIDRNFDHAALWDVNVQPMRVVLDKIEEMDGMTKLGIAIDSSKTTKPPLGRHYSALAAKNSSGIRIMLTYYSYLLADTSSKQYNVAIRNLSPGTTYSVTHFRIDHTHLPSTNMNMGTSSYTANAAGTVQITVTMPASSVSFFDLSLLNTGLRFTPGWPSPAAPGNRSGDIEIRDLLGRRVGSRATAANVHFVPGPNTGNEATTTKYLLLPSLD